MQTNLLTPAANAATAVTAVSDLKKPTLGGGVQPDGSAASSPAPFSSVLKDAMSNLEGLEQQASSTVEGLIAGRGVDIHEAMIATQKSDLAFEMALAVRGKMVGAYQAMMGVQF